MTTTSPRFSCLRRRVSSLLSILAILTWSVPPGFAQPMEELVVTTARGRAEAVRDVPASITVLTQDDIESKGIERVEDFVALTPGVTIVNAAEVADTQVNIRGINGSRDAENSYALIIDGVLMTNPAALNREYANLAQIEILKGPQGALYGRNAAAGAIIITTQEPGDEFNGQVRASAAQDDSYFVAGRVDGPLSEALRWQLTADYRDTDGFYQNAFDNTDDTIDNFENWNVAGRLIWEPGDATVIDTKVRYGEVDAASITFNSVFHIPTLVPILEFLGQPPASAAAAYADVNDHNFQFNPNIESFNDQEALELSIRGEHDLGWADFVGWFLYSDIDNSLGADGTSGAFQFFFTDQRCIDTTNANGFFPVNPPQILIPEGAFGPGTGGPFQSLYGAYTPTSCDGTQYQERNQQDFNVEFRLRSKDDQRLRWEAGIYYLNVDREVGVNLGIDRTGTIVESLFTTDPTNPTEQLVHDNFDSDVYAIFWQLAYDLTEDLEASLALRYDRENRDVTNLVPTDATTEFLICDPIADPTTDFVGGAPINPGLCLDPTGASADKSKDFSEFQPKVSLTWDARDNLTAYASVGVGFKSGGFNNFGSAATVDTFINDFTVAGSGFSRVEISDDFKEETSTSWEIGLKSDVTDTLSVEGAIYYVDVEDMQFFEFFVGQFGLLRVVNNIDEVSIEGIEITASWTPADWIDVYAGGNWLDSEIDQFDSRPDTVGNESPYTADYTFNIGTNIAWQLTSALELVANLNLSSVGDTWFHAVQGQMRPTIFDPVFGTTGSEFSVTKRDSYELVDARIGVAGENWSVVAFGRNIFDEEWLQEVIPAPEFGGTFIHPGTESRFGVEATYRF